MAEPSQADRLYQLLPAIHRMRDAERGEPLRALLRVIGGQLDLIERDIERLFENWFIETCDDWVVPYIGDLIGFRSAAVGDNAARTTGSASARRAVANTIRHRRRKGTLALLEELAADVASWPARAVEFSQLLAVTSAVNHPSGSVRGTVDVRDVAALDRLEGPFDSVAHSVEVRRNGYNLPSVGLFVWRLRAHSITRAPACCIEEAGPEWYTFSALENDTPLFVRPTREADATSIAGPEHVPGPIRRRALQADLASGKPPIYYGVVPGTQIGQSFAIWADDWPVKGAGAGPIAPQRVIAADLSEFQYTPPRDHVAVDPELGRIAFPSKQLPKHGVWVSYHTGFSADLGGGEYPRPLSAPEGAELIYAEGQEQLRHALQPWQSRRSSDAAEEQPEHAVIEIAGSGVYVLPLNLAIAAGHTLQLRAADGARPGIRLLDWQTDRPDCLSITGGKGSRFTLDGVVVAGRGMRIEGELSSVTIRHSTLVPGWTLEPSCNPKRPAEPSIELVDTAACLVIEHSIVGPIQVNVDEVNADPVPIQIRDSIVDATTTEKDSSSEAIGASACERAHAVVTIARSTIIGRVMVHAIELAENSIFTGRVTVARRQIGCIRYCSLTACSRTPRRFHCQPDEAERVAIEQRRRDDSSPPSEAELSAIRERERARVRPRFNSLRYGTIRYAQLASDCAPEITTGADDRSEMGAFHDLFQPQRTDNLRLQLEDHVPSNTDVGIIFVT